MQIQQQQSLIGRIAITLGLGLAITGCGEDADGGAAAGSSGAVTDDDDGGNGATTSPADDDDGASLSDGDDTTTAGDDTTPDPDGTGGCIGCLDADGACQPGTADDACGALGDACQACPGELQCAEGECLEPPACSPENCDGCCDGDTCLDGGNAEACGADGVQCSTCPDGSACSGGACEVPCELSCDGCCTGDGTCVEADAQDENACGIGVDACVACDAGSECIEGQCVSSACAETCDGCCEGDTCHPGTEAATCGTGGGACTSCGTNFSCDASVCEPELDALWDVEVLQAVIAPTDDDGDPWDAFNGLPDPYAVMSVAGMSGESSVIDDELFPEWNEVVLTGVSTLQLLESFELAIADSDFGFDTTMCGGPLALSTADFDTPVGFTCSVNDVEAWSMFFQIVPTAG